MSINVSRAHPDDGGYIKAIGCGTCGKHRVEIDDHRFEDAYTIVNMVGLMLRVPNHQREIAESSIECEEINGRHGDITTVMNGVQVCLRCKF